MQKQAGQSPQAVGFPLVQLREQRLLFDHLPPQGQRDALAVEDTLGPPATEAGYAEHLWCKFVNFQILDTYKLGRLLGLTLFGPAYGTSLRSQFVEQLETPTISPTKMQ
jgi:hypothetical protein